MSQAVVLYHEASLYAEDVASIAGGWLTSNALDLFLCHVERERCASGPEVGVLHPGMLMLVSLAADADEVRASLAGLDLDRRELILLPLNNAAGAADRGSHWSLLVFERAARRFCHYDSLPGNNASVARRVFQKMAPAVGCAEATLEECDGGRQDNGCDCGAFLCANAEIAVSRFLGVQPQHSATPQGAQHVRQFMMELVEKNKRRK